MAFRSYEKRESVYLNIEEARLIKKALIDLLKENGGNIDMICELVVEMNECIKENKEREARNMDTAEPFSFEELLDEV